MRGKIRLAGDEVYFADAESQPFRGAVNANAFEQAMAAQPLFLEQIRDDSFAFTLNDHLRVMGADLCTLDGSTTWSPEAEESSDTIVRLRDFGEHGDRDFGYSEPQPNPPRTKGSVIAKALADAGWRYEDEFAWLGQDEDA